MRALRAAGRNGARMRSRRFRNAPHPAEPLHGAVFARLSEPACAGVRRPLCERKPLCDAARSGRDEGTSRGPVNTSPAILSESSK